MVFVCASLVSDGILAMLRRFQCGIFCTSLVSHVIFIIGSLLS